MELTLRGKGVRTCDSCILLGAIYWGPFSYVLLITGVRSIVRFIGFKGAPFWGFQLDVDFH